MTRPSVHALKRLFALSRNLCAHSRCGTPIVQPSGVVTGDVCHIKAASPEGPRYDAAQTDAERHDFTNLILLCRVHHAIIDADSSRYPSELLFEMKEMHERDGSCELYGESARLASIFVSAVLPTIEASGRAQVMVSSPGAVQAQHVENIVIKTSRPKVSAVLPSGGAIGHDLQMRNYVLHLIERYNEFQKWDSTKAGRGKYIVIYRAIKREFGAKWDFVPTPKFENLVAYLQSRILNSKLGRIKTSRGERCFSTWEEWCARNTGS